MARLFLGVTLGYVSALCGLFLYFPEANGDVIRCFIPAQAAKTCSIDAPIGQVLVDQKAVSSEAVGAALNLQAMMRSQRLGQYLTENRIVSRDQLAAALELKRNRPNQRLGEALVELGCMSRPELDMALDSEALERTMPIGQILLKKMGIVDQQAINSALASRLGVPMVDLKPSQGQDRPGHTRQNSGGGRAPSPRRAAVRSGGRARGGDRECNGLTRCWRSCARSPG